MLWWQRWLLGLAPLLAGCSAGGPALELHGSTMGTTWSVKLAGIDESQLPALRGEVQQLLDRTVGQMSTWEPDSDLSRFNRAEAGTWQVLPPELFVVIEYALELARDTGGAYDPTVGPLVNLWGFGPDGAVAEPPGAAAIAAARARVGWQRIELDPARRAMLQPGGLYVDLSSIGEGVGIDRIAEHLDRRGVANYLVEIGGELRARGRRPDGQPWRVAIERPEAGTHAVERVIELHDRAVSTSGSYRQFFDSDGRRYSHIVDPRTGRPVTHALASVSVLDESSMRADALDTVLAVLGPDEGMAWARARGVAALFFVHAGDGLEARETPAFAAAIRR